MRFQASALPSARLHAALMKCLAASFNTKCQWAVAGRTSAPVVTGFEKTAANFTLAFQRVRRDAKSIRCCLGGQPEFSFHAPTSVSGADWNEGNDLAGLAVDHLPVVIKPANFVELAAVRLFTSV